MKKITIIAALVLICISVLPAEGLWKVSDGEYYTRIVFRGDAPWTDGNGVTGVGMAYVGIYGTTYGLPSPAVAIRLYLNREDNLDGTDLRRGGPGSPEADLDITLRAAGSVYKVRNSIVGDKVYLTGRDAINFCNHLIKGRDVTLEIDIRGTVFTVSIPHSGFGTLFAGYLARPEFLTIGKWNIDRAEEGTGTYTSITRYTNEDPDAAIYFELYGTPERPNSLQSVKIVLYMREGDMAWKDENIEKAIVSHSPEKEWVIEENVFGSCYIDPLAREDLMKTIENDDRVSIRVRALDTGKLYTVDFDRDEFVRHVQYPYDFLQ